MKIVNYQLQQGFSQPRMGILIEDPKLGDKIIDPNYCFSIHFKKLGFYNYQSRADQIMPSSLHSLLTLFDSPIKKLKEALYIYNEHNYNCDFSLTTTSLLCPLDKITSYRDFYAHEKHVKIGFAKRQEKIPDPWFEMPVFYKGNTAGFIGPNEKIIWPSYSNKLDYELELAIIISKDGQNIKAAKAQEHIFGFTILNDISARDIQKKEMMVRLGPSKGKDFCSILGPIIVTFDEFDFKEPNLLMQAFINGEKWSEGYSGDSKFSFTEMIEFASKDEWVRAGDLFGSGTVGTGCGLELDKWIQPGDQIILKVENIGELSNIVGQKNKGCK